MSETRVLLAELPDRNKLIAFEHNRIGVNQVLAVRPGLRGESGFAPTRGAMIMP